MGTTGLVPLRSPRSARGVPFDSYGYLKDNLLHTKQFNHCAYFKFSGFSFTLIFHLKGVKSEIVWIKLASLFFAS
jgi:hypothetical protein